MPANVKIIEWTPPPRRYETIPPQPCLCRFYGDAIPGTQRELLGLDHRKDWHECEHPAQPLGPAVCVCMGCGQTCPGYETPLLQ